MDGTPIDMQLGRRNWRLIGGSTDIPVRKRFISGADVIVGSRRIFQLC